MARDQERTSAESNHSEGNGSPASNGNGHANGKSDSNGASNGTAKKKPQAALRASAESLARGQRDISVSEFFVKNRHLLGFDNPRKALLTTVKEAVDNSIDACD